MVSPYIFLVIVFSKLMTFLVIVTTPTLSAFQVCPVLQCSLQIQPQKLISGVAPLDGVTRGGPSPQ